MSWGQNGISFCTSFCDFLGDEGKKFVIHTSGATRGCVDSRLKYWLEQ